MDRALCALLRRDVLGDEIEISLEAPNRPWSQGVARPTLNLFMFDVRENVSRRDVMHEPVRDDSGAVVARRPPPSRYDLFYILSVWGCPPPLEHQVLAAVLTSLGSYDLLPAELMPPGGSGHGCFLSTAAGMKRGMLPTFSGDLKIQLDLSVTVPFVAPVAVVAGPPVRESAKVLVRDRTPEEIVIVNGRPTVPSGPPSATADPFAPIRSALGAAVAALPPAKPPAPPPGQRPGGPPPGQRPAGPPPQAQRPGGPASGQPAQQPPNPLASLRVALAQAAQAQAALAQAVAGLSTLLPAPQAAPQQKRPTAAPDGPPPA